MPLIRKILFLVFTVVYLVVCTLLILYAMGYIYNPVRQQFVQTGIIRLESMPAGADIFLEKSRYESRTPATISGVLPGEYRITLRKKGYKMWSNVVVVDAGKATTFERILLMPEQRLIRELSQKGFEELIPLVNQYLFLVASGSNLGSFYVFEKNKELRPLLNSASPLFAASVTKIYHVAKSDVLVAEDGSFWNRKYLYLNIEKLPAEANDITSLFTSRPDFIKWDAQNPMSLYTAGSRCINLINVEARQVYPCYLEDVRGFGIYGEYAYAIDANSVFWRMSSNKKKRQILSENMHLAADLFKQNDFYDIVVTDNGITLFLGTNGEIIAQRPPYHISDKGVVGYEFNSNGNLLLYWDKKSIGMADFSKQKTENIFQAAFSTQILYARAKNIRQCFWVYKDSHVLCNDDDTLYLIELQPQGASHAEFVGKVLKDSQVMYSENTGTVYYLDADIGTLQECRILPSEALPLLSF